MGITRYHKTENCVAISTRHLADAGRGDFEIPSSPKTGDRNLENEGAQWRPSQLRGPERRPCQAAPWRRLPPTFDSPPGSRNLKTNRVARGFWASRDLGKHRSGSQNRNFVCPVSGVETPRVRRRRKRASVGSGKTDSSGAPRRYEASRTAMPGGPSEMAAPSVDFRKQTRNLGKFEIS